MEFDKLKLTGGCKESIGKLQVHQRNSVLDRVYFGVEILKSGSINF